MGTYFPGTYNLMKDKISMKSKINYFYEKIDDSLYSFAKVSFFLLYHTTPCNYIAACMSHRIIV